MNIEDLRLAVVGLGYVGLPLAIEFSMKRKLVAFDIDRERVISLQSGLDKNNEFSEKELTSTQNLKFTHNSELLASCNCYIITVPTPIDEQKEPDLTALCGASRLVGGYLCKNDIVIYESTVYPGVTEDVCAPILTEYSGLELAKNDIVENNNVFFLGYSPERINPGDRDRTLRNIMKITSGNTQKTAYLVDELYSSIVSAGTHLAASIRIAEAAKVIENTQRDVNIALINELSIIFDKMNIDTEAVLKAAETKWNFHSFRPGLVGGHCIGVDPYYLAYQASQYGYIPDVLLAGRRMNDRMSEYCVEKMSKLLFDNKIDAVGAKILVLGLTFKQNCSDTRNSKVIDLVNGLDGLKCKVDVFDPFVGIKRQPEKLRGKLVTSPNKGVYDGIIIAVAHDCFIELGAEEIRSYGKVGHVLYDLKYILTLEESDARL